MTDITAWTLPSKHAQQQVIVLQQLLGRKTQGSLTNNGVWNGHGQISGKGFSDGVTAGVWREVAAECSKNSEYEQVLTPVSVSKGPFPPPPPS